VSRATWNAAPDSDEGPPQERHCPNPAHGEGEYQQAEGEVKRNYHPGGIWQRGKVGLGRTSPSLAPWQVAGRGLRGFRPWEIVIARFVGQFPGTGTGWGGGAAV
jgi:hypothetical protein